LLALFIIAPDHCIYLSNLSAQKDPKGELREEMSSFSFQVRRSGYI